MLTSFEQLKDWITDNAIKRWVLYKDHSKTEKITDSQYFAASDMADKLAMTEKYLRMSGGSAFVCGSATNSANDLNITCDIQINGATQGASGIGGYPNIGELRQELTDSITKQLRAEMYAEDMKRREKDLEQREKEFSEKQNGVIGALVNVFAPYLPVLNQVGKMRAVAGTGEERQDIIAGDAEDPDNIQAPENATEQEESPFTEEEANELFTLMAEWKAVEPDYLKMLRKVVDMAKSGDKNYQMAKTVLV